MKTITETKTLFNGDWNTLDALIEKLNEIRANTNHPVNVNVSGNGQYGYRIQLSWERDMTEEEKQRYEEYHVTSEEAAKEMRRKQYEKLRAEFEPQVQAA